VTASVATGPVVSGPVVDPPAGPASGGPAGPGVPWAAAPAGTRGRLRGEHRCDVAIVGAGLTGLSSALALLELDPDLRVAVVEADHVGAGASGRATGLLGPRVGPALRVTRRRHGDAIARAAHLWSVDAVRHVLELVERHRIDCDLVPGRQLVVAATDAEAEELRAEADAARELGLAVPLLGAGDLPPVAGGHTAGLRYAPAATLDPAALTGALARLGEQRGLAVFERSPARRVEPGLLTRVRTDDGALVADHVVLAVNGYDPPDRSAGVLGLRVQAGVTGKLPEAALAALDGLRTEPLLRHGELAPYFRLTADGRLVVGGGVVVRDGYGSVAPAPGKLRAAVAALSPALAGVEVESTWSGPVGITRDGLPVLGRDRRGERVYRAGGCNGHGLAVSAYQGAHLARWIVGGPDALALPWVRAAAPWLPRGRIADRVLDRYLARLSAAAG
jgi:gamma-glutamylputrescine oxidase